MLPIFQNKVAYDKNFPWILNKRKINYKKGIRGLDAINRAGGVTDLAKKSSAFVIYQNGNVASFKNFLFELSMFNL